MLARMSLHRMMFSFIISNLEDIQKKGFPKLPYKAENGIIVINFWVLIFLDNEHTSEINNSWFLWSRFRFNVSYDSFTFTLSQYCLDILVIYSKCFQNSSKNLLFLGFQQLFNLVVYQTLYKVNYIINNKLTKISMMQSKTNRHCYSSEKAVTFGKRFSEKRLTKRQPSNQHILDGHKWYSCVLKVTTNLWIFRWLLSKTFGDFRLVISFCPTIPLPFDI